jgi:carbon-monoxide dehydrogenase large subunit
MMATTVPKQIGARIRRKEDPRLITGSSTYTDDIKLPGMLSMVLVRSPHAHARITEIDVSEAEGMDGVVAVTTGADLEGSVAGLPVAHKLEDLKEPPHRALSIDKVRYVGDAVAPWWTSRRQRRTARRWCTMRRARTSPTSFRSSREMWTRLS